MWARHGAPRSQPTLSTAVHPGSDGWRAKISPARPSGLRHSPLVQLIFASALHIEFCLARARPSDAGRVRSSPRRARPLHRRTASKQSNPRSDSRSHQRMALGTARYYSEHIIQRHLPPQSRPTASPSAREASLRAHITWYDRRRADLVASWHMPRGCSGSTPWPRAVMARIAERWLCHHHLHLLHQPLRLLLGLDRALADLRQP